MLLRFHGVAVVRGLCCRRRHRQSAVGARGQGAGRVCAAFRLSRRSSRSCMTRSARSFRVAVSEEVIVRGGDVEDAQGPQVVALAGAQRSAGIEFEAKIAGDEGIGECPGVFGRVLHDPDLALEDG